MAKRWNWNTPILIIKCQKQQGQWIKTIHTDVTRKLALKTFFTQKFGNTSAPYKFFLELDLNYLIWSNIWNGKTFLQMLLQIRKNLNLSNIFKQNVLSYLVSHFKNSALWSNSWKIKQFLLMLLKIFQNYICPLPWNKFHTYMKCKNSY